MVQKIGHRGAWGYEPENTLVSFQKAIELGVDMIELDVHLSKDKHPIVIHDETLNRTTTEKGTVAKKTLKEIKNYRTKEKNQPIPTLQEVFDQFGNKVKINVEIKGAKAARRVADLIEKNKVEQSVIVSSSKLRSLKIVKKKLPKTEIALIYYSTKTVWGLFIFAIIAVLIFPITKRIVIKRARKARADYVHLYFLFATKGFIAKLHKLGLKVNVWTVNNEKRIRKLIANGVDGIFSNYPDRIKP
jgi:glycerophosphoryl diester phosphodiesterase